MTFAEFPASDRTAGLSASNTILQNILNTAREAVLVLDESMRIKASNKAAYDAFARGNGTLNDRRLSELIRDMKLHETFRV
ncbi:MAG TPA: hypothetical protein VK612_12675, partial [Pyrinomonadaceae bacterium]|nr:hypothetical protein [Pyrinomonadaceae bacterium]